MCAAKPAVVKRALNTATIRVVKISVLPTFLSHSSYLRDAAFKQFAYTRKQCCLNTKIRKQ